MEAAFNTSSSSSIPLSFSYTFTAAAMGAAAFTTSSSTNPWMDPRIWSKLPTKLLDRIIAFLPPPSFFRSRSVSKRWYSLLFSTPFLHLYLHLSPRRPSFLFFKHKPPSTVAAGGAVCGGGGSAASAGYLFDPHDLLWHRIPSPSLIPPNFTPAASSGGLLCWVSDEPGPKTIFLSNPLLGSVSQLPTTLRPRLFPSIGLSVGPSSIHVAVAGDDLISPYAVKNISTETFHVDAAGFYSFWGTTSQLPRLCSLETGQMVNAAEGRFLYCMNHSPYSVLGHDVVSNSWFKLQAPMRRFLRSPSLIESRGRVVLVAAVEKSKLNVPRSLRMWALQQGGATWVEIERMPQQLYAQFADVEGGRGFDCVGHGEFVVIVIRRCGNRGVLFDMLRKIWQWIPLCPYVDHEEDELRGFAYEPRLATPVTGLLDQLSLANFHSFN
ncbi:Protein UNUSUAL FLORAL ORGANS [Linum perenne]